MSHDKQYIQNSNNYRIYERAMVYQRNNLIPSRCLMNANNKTIRNNPLEISLCVQPVQMKNHCITKTQNVLWKIENIKRSTNACTLYKPNYKRTNNYGRQHETFYHAAGCFHPEIIIYFGAEISKRNEEKKTPTREVIVLPFGCITLPKRMTMALCMDFFWCVHSNCNIRLVFSCQSRRKTIIGGVRRSKKDWRLDRLGRNDRQASRRCKSRLEAV